MTEEEKIKAVEGIISNKLDNRDWESVKDGDYNPTSLATAIVDAIGLDEDKIKKSSYGCCVNRGKIHNDIFGYFSTENNETIDKIIDFYKPILNHTFQQGLSQSKDIIKIEVKHD